MVAFFWFSFTKKWMFSSQMKPKKREVKEMWGWDVSVWAKVSKKF